MPIADTLLAMMRRAARGAPMFSADRGHIHHRLLALGLSHRQTVLVLYGASILLGGVALVLSFSTASQATYVLLALSAVAYLALRHLGFFSVAQVHRVLDARKRNLNVRREIRRVGETLRCATTMDDVWAALRLAADTVGADAIALHLPADSAGGPHRLTHGFEGRGAELFRARYGVLPERPGDTHLELGWSDGRTVVERDTEIAVELLCDHLAAALERVELVRGPYVLPKVAGLRG